MDKKHHKGNESSPSSATTSSEINNSFAFANLSFLDNYDSSVQAEAPTSHSIRPAEQLRQSISKSIAHDYQMNKPTTKNILPNKLYQVIGEQAEEAEAPRKEVTLAEIGFKTNEIDGWENIIQPPKQNLYDLIKNMVDNVIKPNVQVKIGEIAFNCHMIVLQCYSDFFMECTNEVIVQLPPERITSKAFMMVYDWMLSAEPQVQREGILELFNAANFLKIKGLVDQCWVCLDDDIRFQEDTAFLLYLEARNYGLDMLQQLMLTRICKFFLTLVASKDFVLLSAKEVCSLLSSNSIGVNSEVEILMAAVRWLSYNWAERQPYLVDVISCVRFGLVPPWILVALGRDTDCIGVERVVENPEVKKMIEDGLSYTTTQLFYSDNEENFIAFLERYHLTKPVQRQWICDQDCSYHHKVNCPNRQYITYEAFVEYLDVIRSKGKDYWKELKMETKDGLNFQCCLPTNNHPEQYFCNLLPKESRDQGVQVSGEQSDCDEPEPIRTSKSVELKTWYQEAYSPKRMHADGQDVLRNVSSAINENSDNNPGLLSEANGNVCPSQRSSSCCDFNLKATNIKSILAKSYYCSISSQKLETTMTAVAIQHQQHYESNDVAQTARRNSAKALSSESMMEGRKHTVPSAVKDIHSKQVVNTGKLDAQKKVNLGLPGQNILIFGGIDPYTQIRPCDMPGMDVLYYDGCENIWKHLLNMPGSRHHHSAVLFRGKIYIIGGTRPALAGTSKAIFESAVWSFDYSRFEWHNECTLPQPRRDFGLIAYESDNDNNTSSNDQGERLFAKSGLYIIGGESTDGMPLSSTLYYNVDKKFWLEKPSLNIGRYGLVAAIVNIRNSTEIWIAGGVCGQEKGGMPVITDVMESYSLSKEDGSWKQLAKRLRIPRLFARFCAVNGGRELYVVGGIGLDSQRPREFVSLSSVDCYDFEEERWMHLTDMITSRHGHDAVVANGKIFIIGGVSADEKRTLESIECLYTKTATWQYDMAFLPYPLSGLAAVLIDNDI